MSSCYNILEQLELSGMQALMHGPIHNLSYLWEKQRFLKIEFLDYFTLSVNFYSRFTTLAKDSMHA